MNKEDIKKEIRRNPSSLKGFKELSEDIMIYAVKEAWNNLKYIVNPTRNTILEAIDNKGWAIQYVKDKDDEMKKRAVKRDGDSISFIENPSEELQKIAVENNWKSIKYIKSPSRDVKVMAVKENEQALGYISDYDDEDIRSFLKENIRVVKYIYDSLDMDVLRAVLMEKFQGKPSQEYIKDFMELKMIDLDKVNFIKKFGSEHSKRMLVDYMLGR